MQEKENNIGDRNIGDRNIGDRNIGDRNIGYSNFGYRNLGYNNIGNSNLGYRNIGDRNIGDRNIGDSNFGSWNLGYRNIGNSNIGDNNIGNSNIGNSNIGDNNIGCFNSTSPNTIRVFNKECDKSEWENCIMPQWLHFSLNFDITARLHKWVSYENMSDEDKKNNPNSEKLGGYLLGGIRKELSKEEKIEIYKNSAQKNWNHTTEEDRQLTFKLPNFDADVFFKIFGIDVVKNIS